MESQYTLFDTKYSGPDGTLELCWENLEADAGKRDLFLSKLKSSSNTTLQYLDISGNALGKCPKEFIKQAVDAINQSPIKFTQVDLSFNKLGSLSANDLCQLLGNLPFSIEKINLTHNLLHKFSRDELLKIVDSIPRSVQKVDFAHNSLTNETLNELENIIQNRPENTFHPQP